MSHPIVFFRKTEFNAIAKEYSLTKKAIDTEVENYFLNTNSLNNLYYKVELLENKQDYYKSFNNTANAIESWGKSSIQNSSPLYSDPFSYNHFQSFNPLSSKGGFYIGIFIMIVFLLAIIKKWKIRVFIGLLLMITIGLNLYNYYVKEPEFLKSADFYINPTEYKNEKLFKVASDIYTDLYQPKESYAAKVYEYEVDGIDNFGDYVEGMVETSGKYGEGYIYNEYGDKIDIKVEWVDYGKLIGTDEHNDEYKLKVKHE
jgi:hypothetical protein